MSSVLALVCSSWGSSFVGRCAANPSGLGAHWFSGALGERIEEGSVATGRAQRRERSEDNSIRSIGDEIEKIKMPKII